jgi:hypothetical protein
MHGRFIRRVVCGALALLPERETVFQGPRADGAVAARSACGGAGAPPAGSGMISIGVGVLVSHDAVSLNASVLVRGSPVLCAGFLAWHEDRWRWRLAAPG